MKPPIFSGPSVQAAPHQYLHRSRMFRDAMSGRPNYVNGEVNWPLYAMLTHAIELALKAYVHHAISVDNLPKGKEPKQHDLAGWYRLAVELGLPDEPGIMENVDLLNDLHFTNYLRYPQHRSKPVPGPEAIADSTVDHLITIITSAVIPR